MAFLEVTRNLPKGDLTGLCFFIHFPCFSAVLLCQAIDVAGWHMIVIKNNLLLNILYGYLMGHILSLCVCVYRWHPYTSSTPDDGLELAETYLWCVVCIEVAVVICSSSAYMIVCAMVQPALERGIIHTVVALL